MKILKLMKDGGALSRVWGYFLIEWKPAFSFALLHFKDGSREAYHSHAFNAISWIIKGHLTEEVLDGETKVYRPSLIPIFTPRNRFHKVTSKKNTWVITIRGPWAALWMEFIPGTNQKILLTHGRKEIGEIISPESDLARKAG